MARKFIWIKRRKYYLYDKFDTWDEALRIARMYKRKDKRCGYFIRKAQIGFMFPQTKYLLYMDRVKPIW